MRIKSVALTGDFLVVAGAINANTSKGGFSFVRRMSSVASQPVASSCTSSSNSAARCRRRRPFSSNSLPSVVKRAVRPERRPA